MRTNIMNQFIKSIVSEYARDVKNGDKDSSAIFIDICNNIYEVISERMMLKEGGSDIYKYCDVVALLDLVDMISVMAESLTSLTMIARLA